MICDVHVHYIPKPFSDFMGPARRINPIEIRSSSHTEKRPGARPGRARVVRSVRGQSRRTPSNCSSIMNRLMKSR